MGLAAYGSHNEGLYQLLREMLVVSGLGLAPISDANKLRFVQWLHQIRRTRDQPPLAAADLAFTAPHVFSRVLYELLNNLHARGNSPNLIYGGGCALNSSAYGAILENTAFENLFVFSAPADDGNAVGAGLLAWHQDHPQAVVSPPEFQTPYLGSRLSDDALMHLRCFGGRAKLTECHGSAPERAAEMLARGKIVGWIQGRAEFGPRALGNRSILADPRSATMKENINAKVKFREEFRPFAPSILHEYGSDYFEHYQ